MRRSATPFGVTTLGLFAAAPALAVADDQTAQTPTHQVSGVVVTAPPPPAPLASAFTQSTISSVQIEKLSPAPTMTAQTMLNSQPSIFAFTDGPFGVRTTITFRAFNSGEFTETYDGVALNDAFNAAVTGGAENVNNVLLQTQAFADTGFTATGRTFSFLRPVVGAPLGVTGSVSAKF